jgi:2-polyprenyl-3-methyl-5-hydroxy-6-metoxy-1,4-benzoquinol methylase/FtsZ-binding cell division protein ZapB
MDQKGEELAAVIAEIRDRVRARNPNGVVAGDIALPDLTPLVHARDAAEAKVASIGTVNPRAPGLVNSIVQGTKRLVARALDWHVREQVEFNRAAMVCMQATIEALNECNRTMARIAVSSHTAAHELRQEAQQLKDIRAHWVDWRAHWEKKLAESEIHILRVFAELQASFQHRVTLMDQNYREQVREQHSNYEAALLRAVDDTHKRFWEDLDRVRTEYETIIHAELRMLRQKASLTRMVGEVAERAPADFSGVDWLKFAEKFRGSEAAIRERQQNYAARFRGSADVLDIGCGRGEMLDVFRENGVGARGIDMNDDSIAVCRGKGLDVEKADIFAYLDALPDSSLGGAVCCQVVEHLPPERMPELMRLLHPKLRTGALVAFETPNPECLAIFATHFYLDPTHRHPIPVALLSFYLEEAGFGRLEVERLSPAVEAMPSLAGLPEAFRRDFFGWLDYVVFAIKLG